MKAQLIYDLSDREDTLAHLRAVHSTSMALVLWETMINGHNKLVKHKDVSDEYAQGVQDVFSLMTELCINEGIDIEQLIE